MQIVFCDKRAGVVCKPYLRSNLKAFSILKKRFFLMDLKKTLKQTAY
jgi:hypothetical protein